MVTVNLAKGTRIDLSKSNPGLAPIQYALGWDERKKSSPDEADYDPDVSVVVLHSSRPFSNPGDLLYYNSNGGANNWIDKTKPYPFIMGGALKSSGDERTGGKEGDDEVITVSLKDLADDVTHVVPIVTIYEYKERKQNFGMMQNAYCRIEAPGVAGFDVQKADLTEDYSAYQAMIPGYFYKKDGNWKYFNSMLGVNESTTGVNGKAIGTVDLETIANNLTAILGIAVAPAAVTAK